jgi:YHS domain-containing protein
MKMVIDPVCKMEMDESRAKASLVFEGSDYYFCSEGCLAEFQRHSDEYSKPFEAFESCLKVETKKEKKGRV